MAQRVHTSLFKSDNGYREVMAQYDATLRSMGVPYEEIVVETNYGQTYAIASGSKTGASVVLWHGQNANSATWARWIPALARDYRVYAVDAIGGMGRSAPNRPDKKGPAYGIWAAEAIHGLGLEKANMIGASNGCWLIVKLASVSPERISSAVLMSAAGFVRLSMLGVIRLVRRIAFRSTEQMAQEMLALVSAPGARPDPFYLTWFELMLRHFRGERNAPTLGDCEIQSVSAPTYLLMGQYESTVNPYKVLERGLRLLPQLTAAEIVPGVGHSMVHAQPDWVIKRVRSFLGTYAL
jgi:pimeloyl-ACP methyl ester carboxylesterase